MNTSKIKHLKLFRINTYKKTGEGVPPCCGRDVRVRDYEAQREERSLHFGRDDRSEVGMTGMGVCWAQRSQEKMTRG